MKNVFLIIAVMTIFSITACGKTNKILPVKVKTAFSQKFPKARKIRWDRENNKEWEVEFKMFDKNYSANFDNNGVWKETEYEISANEIPITVKKNIAKEFAAYKIEVSNISETSSGKVYEFDLKKGAKKIEVAIDINGRVIKKEQIKEEKDND